ncbi:sel1 repeat family protein [Terasakiella sp. SH-1]|uniref:tetratricopeptide repeat protein n=1 Tax=Terasakiella sp. SH-1 TaxID=2560057 RepID=UPI0010749430|nr:sel1 repeat family protein [Terasakiella sp. SH-1]
MRFVLFILVILFTLPAYAQTVEDGYKAYDVGDYETAKSIMLLLAEQGNPKAMNAMGNFYSEGKAFPENAKIACDWYEKAANKEYASAQNNLGLK